MSNFLKNLALRSLQPEATVGPRLASRFELLAPGDGLLSAGSEPAKVPSELAPTIQPETETDRMGLRRPGKDTHVPRQGHDAEPPFAPARPGGRIRQASQSPVQPDWAGDRAPVGRAADARRNSPPSTFQRPLASPRSPTTTQPPTGTPRAEMIAADSSLAPSTRPTRRASESIAVRANDEEQQGEGQPGTVRLPVEPRVERLQPALATEELPLPGRRPTAGSPLEPAGPAQSGRRTQHPVEPPAAETLSAVQAQSVAIRTMEQSPGRQPPWHRQRRLERGGQTAPDPGQQPAPTIQVSIGRIEVRATRPPAPALPRERTNPSVMSLDEYLRQRSGGGRR